MSQEIIKRNTERAIKAIRIIDEPISKTISPKGQNVAILKLDGSVIITNDGDKIRRNITSDDAFEKCIIRLIKDSADKTHQQVGDSRSSTIRLTSLLSIEALKLVEDGNNPRDIAEQFTKFKEGYIKSIQKFRIPTTKDALYNVAKISSNNDEEVAKNTIETIDVIGEHGMAFIDINKNGSDTFLEKELGFSINGGVQYKELLLDANVFNVIYKDVPMLITDMRLYSLEEAETILDVVNKAGYDSVVIVARELIKGSDAMTSLLSNHIEKKVKVCMVADPNVTDTENETLYDLASYVDGKVITERGGDLINTLTIKDFTMVKKVFQDPHKALITPVKSSKDLPKRIKSLQAITKKAENKEVEQRLASLTTGNVNIYVGGSTVHEIEEKMDRYRDAISAAKTAMMSGYVVGGGVTLLKAFNSKLTVPEYANTFRKFSEAIVRQIAENCNQHVDTVVKTIKDSKDKNFGYNALTNSYGDLLKTGVLEPLKSLEMVVENSISTAITLSSIATYIINEEDEINKDNK